LRRPRAIDADQCAPEIICQRFGCHRVAVTLLEHDPEARKSAFRKIVLDQIRRSAMNTQTQNKGGFANNLAAQLGLLAVAVAVLVIIAWQYMW
jgi:hypothetical protein